MRLSSVGTWAMAMVGLASADGSSSVFYDSVTGFTFSQYAAKYSLDGSAITFRIAVPANVASGAAYDAVLQIIAPVSAGWGALAWNGGMTQNPLSIAWQNGQSAMISSRWAASHVAPSPYTGASYQVLRTGTKTNGTHYQITVKCSGCTKFGSTTLSSTASHRLAFAYCATKPSSPSSNTSSITVHDVHDYWNHDFASAQNPSFADLVAKNA